MSAAAVFPLLAVLAGRLEADSEVTLKILNLYSYIVAVNYLLTFYIARRERSMCVGSLIGNDAVELGMKIHGVTSPSLNSASTYPNIK